MIDRRHFRIRDQGKRRFEERALIDAACQTDISIRVPRVFCPAR
jgi:hypothetical protein